MAHPFAPSSAGTVRSRSARRSTGGPRFHGRAGRLPGLHRTAAPSAGRKVHFEALEPRVLLSADLMPWAGDGAQDNGERDLHPDGLTGSLELIDMLDAAAPLALVERQPDETAAGRDTGAGDDEQPIADFGTPYALPSGIAISAGDDVAGLVIGNDSLDQATARQVVFVDPGVRDYQSLLGGMSLESRGTEIVVLDAASDGVGQITEFLQANSGISAVHILSHGGSGSLTLGSSQLDGGTLDTYADQIATWRSALTGTADILLYGCNVAAGAWGIGFVEDLAALTGADVAASDDLTGAAALGGDWVLEMSTGVIESPVLFAAGDYQHVLGGNFEGLKAGTSVAGGSLTGTLDFTDGRFDTIKLTSVSGELTLKFSGEQLQITNKTGSETATLTLTGIRDVSVAGAGAGDDATLVQFEKGAEFGGVTIDLTKLGGNAKTLSFTNNFNDPDALGTGGEKSRVVLSAPMTGPADRYQVSVGNKTATLKGFAGAKLVGGTGVDVFAGSATVAANDHFLGGQGGDTAFGELGDDTLEGGRGADRLVGGAGVDTLLGGAGADELEGGAGNDTLKGDTFTVGVTQEEPSASNLFALAGSDTLRGEAGNDTLEGGAGSDTLDGGADNDTQRGGKGADTYLFESGWGVDTIVENEDEGKDRLDFSAVAENLSFDLGAPDVTGQDPTGLFIITDTSTPANRAEANAFIETLTGGKGTNTYKVTQKFVDEYAADGFNNRTLNVSNALVGGVSVAVLDLSGVTVPLKVVIKTNGTDPNSNKVTVTFNPSTVTGGLLSTKMVVTNVAQITTGSGNDQIVFEEGAKLVGSLETGDGNDRITFKKGTRLVGNLNAGSGDDTLTYEDSALDQSDVEQGVLEPDDATTLSEVTPVQTNLSFTAGGTGDPRVGGQVTGVEAVRTGELQDAVFGDAGENELSGGGGGDFLFGEEGGDTLEGGDGDDHLDGGADDDTLAGGDGDDTLIGGAGDDTLTGGGGEDTFVQEDNWGQDVIEGEGLFNFASDTLDFSKVTADLTYSFASNNINGGTGTFKRDKSLLGLRGDLASGTFTDANANTVIAKNAVNTVKTGTGNQTFYFGNNWNTTIIDRTAMMPGKNLVLDFSGGAQPLRFTFDVVTIEMAQTNAAFANQVGKTFVRIDQIAGLKVFAAGLVLPGGLAEGVAESITVVVDANTKIISGRNDNRYSVNPGADFPGTLMLASGGRFIAVPRFETAVPATAGLGLAGSGLQVGHGIDFTRDTGDLQGGFSNFSNSNALDLLTGVAAKGKLESGIQTLLTGDIFQFSQGLDTLVRNFVDPRTWVSNSITSFDGIRTIEVEPSTFFPAKIGNAVFGSGLNLLQGDNLNNTFSHRAFRPGVHLLSGLGGPDTYEFGNLWGAALILELPDLTVGGDPIPEAIDTLDFSGVVGDVEVDVFKFGAIKDQLATFRPGLTLLSEVEFGHVPFDANVVVAVPSGLGSSLADLLQGLTGAEVDLLRSLPASGVAIGFDIESLVGPKLGELTVRLHGDAGLRGTVNAGTLGTVTLDYSAYGTGVAVDAFNLPDLGPVAGVAESLLNGVIGEGFFSGTTLARDIGAPLPPTTTAGATGIAGHRLGGLTTFADLWGDDNVVSQTLADFAVNGLARVILSPQADTVVSPDVGITVEGQGAGDLVNVPGGTIDLRTPGTTGSYNVNLATGDVSLDGTPVLSGVNVGRVVSGFGDDTLTGSDADETFLFKVEEQADGSFLGWGTDTLRSGGGADKIDLSLPDAWRWEAVPGAGPDTGYTIHIRDDSGALRPSKILLPGTSDFTIVGADGDWLKSSTLLSLDSLVSTAPPAGHAIANLPVAVLEAAIRSFDGLTLRVARTDGSGSDDFLLTVSTRQTLGGTQSVQLIASNGAVLLDSASLLRSFRLTDLPDRQLSTRFVSGEILIDATAADHGWHTDPNAAPPAGKVDLLSVVVHELGQRLRLDPAIAVMQPTVAPGADGSALPALVAQAGVAFVDTPLEVTALPGFAITEATKDVAAVDKVIAEAVARWQAKADLGEVTVLGNSTATPTIIAPTLEFADLSGGELARSLPDGTILLDPTAAGHGWFVDPAPDTNTVVPADRIDLLTVVLHEIGHSLGLGHDAAAGASLLDESLAPGVRLDVPGGAIEVVTLQSSDQSKLARGLDAFSGWVGALGDRIDDFLTTGVDMPLLGNLSLGGLFGLNADAAAQFTAELQSNIIDQVAAVFTGGGPVTNLDIEALANIEFAPTSNPVAYVATVDLPGLDFNQQISLDPAQLELGGLDPSTFGISLDSPTPPLLDVVGGLDLQFIFGLDALGNFYVESPGVEASLSVDSATPFTVGLSLGPFGLEIQNGTVDIGASMRLGTTARLDYDALVHNVLDPSRLIPSLAGGAHWDIDLPLALTGALSGVNADDLAISAHGQIDSGIGSLESIISSIEFETPGLDDILGLVTLNPGLILDLAIAGLDALVQPDSVINQTLPGLNKSVADLLGDGTDDFLTGLKASLESVRGADIGSLQGALNAAISGFLGVTVEPFTIAYEDSVLTVDVDLDYALAAGATAGFGLDLNGFARQLGIDLKDFPGVDIEITDPAIQLALDASVGLDFGFGIDLSDLLNVESFISADSGISVNFSAETAAPVDFAVDIVLGGARVGFRVEDATAELGLGGRFGLADTADGRYAFTGGQIAGLDTEFSIDGRASLDLPIFFPTLSNPLNGTTADLDGDGFGENVLHFGAELEGGSFAFETTAPDLGDLFGLAALLNDPATVLQGLEGIFTTIKTAMEGRFLDINLPLIGDALKDKAAFVDDLREDFLGQTDGFLFTDGGSYLPDSTPLDGIDDRSLGRKLQDLDTAGGSVFEQIVDLIKNGLFDGLRAADGSSLLKVPVTDPITGDPEFDPATGQVIFRPVTSANDIQIEFTGSGITFNVLLGDSLLSEMIDFDFEASAPGLSLSTDDAAVQLDIGYVFGLGFGLDARDGVFLDTSGVTQDGEEFSLDVAATLGDGGQVTAKLGFLQASLKEMAHADAATAQALADEFGVDVDADGNSGLFAGLSFDLADAGGDGRWTVGEGLDATARLFAEANVDLGAKVEIPGTGPISLPEIFTVLHYDQVFADVTFSSSGGGQASFGDAPVLTFENVTLDIGTAISSLLGPIADELAKFIGPGTTLVELMELLTTEIDIGVAKFSLLANDFSDPNKPVIGFVESFAKTEADREKARKTKAAIDKILAFSDFIGAIDLARGESLMISFGDFTVGGSLVSDKPGNNGPAEEVDDFENEGAQDLKQQTAGSNSGAVVDQLGKDKGSIRFPLLQNPANVLGLLMGRRTDLFIYDLPALDIDVGVTKSFPVFPGLNARIGGSIGVTSKLSFGFDTTGIEKWSDDNFEITAENLKLPFEGLYLGDNFDEQGVDQKELTFKAGLRAGASVGISGLVEAGVEGGIEAIVGLDLADIPLPNPDPNIQVGDGRLYFDEIEQRLGQGPQCLFELEGELRAFLEAFFWIGVDAGFFEITIFEARERFVDVVLAQFDFSCPPPSLDVAHLAGDGTLTIRAIDNGGFQFDSAGRGGFGAIPERYDISQINKDFTEDGIDNPLDFIQVVGNGSTEFFDPTAVTNIVVLGTEFDDSYEIDSTIAANITVHGLGGNDTIEVGSDSASHTRTIFGDAGNDILIGSLGADTIFGGAGNDVISGGGGLDQLHGGDDNDFITGGGQLDMIWGDAGDDRLVGGLGGDTLYGGTGNDTLLGEGGNDLLYAVTDTSFVNDPNNRNPRSRDLLSGGLGDDVIHGGDGDDTLIGGRSSSLGDTLEGHDGGDSFLWRVGDGVDRIHGSDAGSDPTANTFDDKVSLLAYAPDADGLPVDPATGDLVTLSASGDDVIADWNGAALQLSGIHSIDLDTGEGADTVVVHDLRGTTLAHDFPLLAADGTPVLLGNLNVALGSSRTIVQELRETLDSNGNPELDENDAPIVEEFDIVSKSGDATADVLHILGEGGVDEFTLTRFSDFDPENSNLIERLKVEQAQGLTINVQEIGFSQDRIVVDAGSGDDRIDASGLDLDLVDDLRLVGGDGDDRLIGTQFSETIIGGLGADRITGDAGIDVFVSPDYPEPARELVGGAPVFDTLIETRDADFTLSDTAITIGGELEALDDHFEAVELTGGNSSNRFTLDAFTGSGFLDGGESGDNYEVTVAQAGADTTFLDIADSGITGIDELLYLGSSGDDLIQLDTVYIAAEDPAGEFASDRWATNGVHGDGLLIVHFASDASAYQKADLDNEDALTGLTAATLAQGNAFQVINYSSVEESRVFAGEGDDKIISDDTAQNMNVYGNAGDDEFYVGSVLGTETVLVEGREVTVVTSITHGASFQMNFYGGADDDYFQINHNAADISLFGDNGDDTFFVRALLTLDENEDVVEVDNKLARVSGVTGEGSEDTQRNDDTRSVDIDALVYVENANIAIDGGAGFDSVAIVGTVLSDTFYVFTEVENGEVVQRIFGAGVKLRELLNIERLQLITGAGDDRVFVYGVDLGPVADMVISTGTGSDTVEFGGPERIIELNFPRKSRTEFASVDGFEAGPEIEINLGLDIGLIDNLARVVPFAVEEPAQTRNRTIAAARSIDGIRSPVIIRDTDGLIDTVVFNNQDGPTGLVFEDRELLRKAIETDASLVVYPTTPRPGTTTDLIAELGTLGAGAQQVVATVNDYLETLVLFNDRYFDTELIGRLQALSDLDTESVTISEGVSYVVFQDTLDAANEFVTSRDQLDAFLLGTGFEATYVTSPHPDPSQTVPLFDIASITNTASGQSLAFEAQYREFVLDDVVLRDLIGVSLITAGPVDVAIESGWLQSVQVVDVDVVDSVYSAGAQPTMFFGGQEELVINMTESTASTLVLDNELFVGKVTAFGGAADDVFDIRTVAGQTFLHGGDGDDDFLISEGFVGLIEANLFLRGDAGVDDVIVRAEDMDAGVDVLFDKNTVQQTQTFERLSRVTNALEFTNLSAIENQIIQDSLQADAVPFAELAAMVDDQDLLRVVAQATQDAGGEIVAALGTARIDFAAEVEDLVVEQRGIFEEFLTGVIQEYKNARKQIDSAQATINALGPRVDRAEDLLDFLEAFNGVIKFFLGIDLLQVIRDGGDISFLSDSVEEDIRSLQRLKNNLKAAQEDLEEGKLRRDGAVDLIAPYVSKATLDSNFASLKNNFDSTAGALINNSGAAQLEFQTIEDDVRAAGQATLDAIDAVIGQAQQLSTSGTDPSAAIAVVLQGLTDLRLHLESAATGANERFVRVARLAAVKDVTLSELRDRLTEAAALFAAIPDASAFDTTAFQADPNWQSALTLFDSASFQSVLAAYDQARDIAKEFVDFRSTNHANLRSVTLNADKFAVFKQELETTFSFEAFKQAYLANVAEVLNSLDLFDDLAVESKLLAQLASLELDQETVNAIVARNAAVTEVFQQLKDDADADVTSVTSALKDVYTITYSFWRFTFTRTLDFSKDFRLVSAKAQQSLRDADLDKADDESQAALADKSAVDGEVADLQAQLAALQASIAAERDRLDTLNDELSAQFRFLRSLSATAVAVLAETRADTAAAEFSDTSSLISEILSYQNDYQITDEPGVTNLIDIFLPGPTGNSVIEKVERSDFFEVLTLSGLNAGGIHAEYDTVENFTLFTGDGADTIRVHDSLGQATSNVFVNSGEGDDQFVVANLSDSVDDIVGNLLIDGEGGDNKLLIDDHGDETGDTIVQQYDENAGLAALEPPSAATYVQLTGMADGDIFYRAIGGGFTQGLEIVTSSGDDHVTLRALYGTDHTELFTGIGEDTVVVDDFLVDLLATLTIYTQSQDDTVLGDAAPLGFTVYGDTGDDLLRGGQHADLLYGFDGEDVIVGGAGTDRIDGEAGDDLIVGDFALLDWTPGSGAAVNPRFRVLTGQSIYGVGGTSDGAVLIDRTSQFGDPAGNPVWADWTITLTDGPVTLDAALLPVSNDDYIAGGSGDDTIFGQQGDDIIQGDGSIASLVAGGPGVGAHRDPVTGLLVVRPSVEAATDGDDYIEGNDGNDVILGNLGQDDIIGGSSGLFSLAASGQRADGSDLIFGGAGTRIGRNDAGDTGAEGHARDADMILGDNGNIFRLVGVDGAHDGAFLTFNYDDYSQALRIIPRAAELIDYTPGGSDFDKASADSDNGAADEVHGEAGDDFIYGMKGPDVLFGDGQDDDLIGGYGHDWISGGTGQDGALGDDGRIFTSRNTAGDPTLLSEPLYGIHNVETDRNSDRLVISTPGDIQLAEINILGQLKKTADLTPFNLTPIGQMDDPLNDPSDADDIIYGGWGGDFLHGGAGDDAISGAEALQQFFDVPGNPGDVLGFGREPNRATEFAAYNEFDPFRKILVDENGVFTEDGTGSEFLLNFDASEGPVDPRSASAPQRTTDGDDAIFGDLGNDWLVGGTGRDRLYGGYGDDLHNADDDHDSTAATTDPRANDVPDTDFTFEDIAFGGAGRDVLLANTGGDRLIDWTGAYNTYLVPFAPFGAFTISRALPPQIFDYLYDLSAADGADPTRHLDGADPARNGEPDGELGLVVPSDAAWRDQTGAPDDPLPGTIAGGARDVLRGADFNDPGAFAAFAADSGSFTVSQGRLQVAPDTLDGDAASVFYVDDVLPGYFELRATINAGKPTGGYKSNAYLIFDYQSPTDFKFAGINISTDKLQMGHRDALGWQVDVQTSAQLKPDQDYDLLLAINGVTATLVVDRAEVFSHSYAPRIVDGLSQGLNSGMVGLGAENSFARIDNVAVQVLPPEITFEDTDDFSDGSADLFTGEQRGDWQVGGSRYLGTPADDRAVSLIDLGPVLGQPAGAFSLGPGSLVELEATLNTTGTAGVIFDYTGPGRFKFAAIDAAGDRVVIGHYTAKTGWTVDASVAYAIEAGVDHVISATLRGASVSVAVDGNTVLGHGFNAVVVDGAMGLMTKDGPASFDAFTVRTDDPAFIPETTGEALTAAAAGPGGAVRTLTTADLAPILDEAVRRLSTEMVLGDAAARLGQVTLGIADLAGLALGRADGDAILIDRDAAGHGWFVDTTPDDDAEFRRPVNGDAALATARSAADGRIDLLSAVMHELGHVVGLDHVDADGNDLMSPTLAAGLRRLALGEDQVNGTPLPPAGSRTAARPFRVTGDHFLARVFDEQRDDFLSLADARMLSVLDEVSDAPRLGDDDADWLLADVDAGPHVEDDQVEPDDGSETDDGVLDEGDWTIGSGLTSNLQVDWQGRFSGFRLNG